MNKKILKTSFLLVLAFFVANFEVNAQTNISAKSVKTVNALEVSSNPHKYLNAVVKMNVTFDKFSALGLDYPVAMRSSEDYIGFLVQRDDIKDHNIPLSELKLFLKRDYAEKFAELDCGDKIEIQGKVFSTALGDPWIDVEKITIKEKVKKEIK